VNKLNASSEEEGNESDKENMTTVSPMTSTATMTPSKESDKENELYPAHWYYDLEADWYKE
jgi:hypothetical protein